MNLHDEQANHLGNPMRRFWRAMFVTAIVVLLVMVVTVCWRKYAAIQQRVIVREIERCGGDPIYYFQLTKFVDGDELYVLPRSWGPRVPVWLNDSLGTDFFSNLHGAHGTNYSLREGKAIGLDPVQTAAFCEAAQRISHLRYFAVVSDTFQGEHLSSLDISRLEWLSITSPLIGDDDLRLVARAKHLKSLELDCPRMSDAGLIHLGQLGELQALRLRSTGVTDQGMAMLSVQPDLRRLNLSGTMAGNATFTHFAASQKLHEVRMDETAISDSGMASLNGFPNLDSLFLQKTSITDQGLKQLPLSQLGSLYLDDTQVTDSVVQTLAQLPELRILSLAGTSVSDVSCALLAKSKRLNEIDLSRTKVTDVGARLLAESIPVARRLSVVLCDTAVGDFGCIALAHSGRIGSLDVRGTQLTKEGYDQCNSVHLRYTLVADFNTRPRAPIPMLQEPPLGAETPFPEPSP